MIHASRWEVSSPLHSLELHSVRFQLVFPGDKARFFLHRLTGWGHIIDLLGCEVPDQVHQQLAHRKPNFV